MVDFNELLRASREADAAGHLKSGKCRSCDATVSRHVRYRDGQLVVLYECGECYGTRLLGPVAEEGGENREKMR